MTHTTDLLIIDEAHRYAADTFRLAFSQVDYTFILGLTATMRRLDRKDAIIRHYAPVVKKLTMIEAKQKGWVADFLEFHLAIDLPEEERKKYNEMHEKYLKYMRVFGMDLDQRRQAKGLPAKNAVPTWV